MLVRELLLPEFDQEMATTRALLAVVPEDRPDWRPHPKSQTLQALVSHVANIPSWMGLTLDGEGLDLAAGGEGWKTPQLATRQAILAVFDAHVEAARARLAQAGDATFAEPWTLRAGEKVFFTQPKVAVVRSFLLNHLIHHRAQLGVYLRLLDVPLPSSYGPTADQPGM